jgi:hypothetical protein
MKDYLQDIVQHTHSLGFIDLVKVTGDANTTTLDSLSEDRSVIVQAQFKKQVQEFVGTFVMHHLGKLNTILGIPEYKEDAKLSINTQVKGTDTIPVGIHFENKGGDFKNDYRFMEAAVVNDKLKTVKMKQVKWIVDITPTVASLQKMKYQAAANSEETTFAPKIENSQLNFYFGDHSSHAGNFVFANGVSGAFSKNWCWPVGAVVSILSLAGDKNLKISDEGVLQITVDSGICAYTYLLPAHQK